MTATLEQPDVQAEARDVWYTAYRAAVRGGMDHWTAQGAGIDAVFALASRPVATSDEAEDWESGYYKNLTAPATEDDERETMIALASWWSGWCTDNDEDLPDLATLSGFLLDMKHQIALDRRPAPSPIPDYDTHCPTCDGPQPFHTAMCAVVHLVEQSPTATPDRDTVMQAVNEEMVDHPIWGDREFSPENEAKYGEFVENVTDAVLAALSPASTSEENQI